MRYFISLIVFAIHVSCASALPFTIMLCTMVNHILAVKVTKGVVSRKVHAYKGLVTTVRSGD